jgi:hypothetical protein
MDRREWAIPPVLILASAVLVMLDQFDDLGLVRSSQDAKRVSTPLTIHGVEEWASRQAKAGANRRLDKQAVTASTFQEQSNNPGCLRARIRGRLGPLTRLLVMQTASIDR